MKVIVAGSRTVTNRKSVEAAIEKSGFEITELVCGMCRGPDMIAKEICEERGIPIIRFPADWGRFGKSAGTRRNAKMAEYADVLVAVWDGSSPGTGNMIELMNKRKAPVSIHNVY